MDFDFAKQYDQFTIPQLLEIIDQRDAYQPAAVAAAEELLARRDPAAVRAYRDALVPEAAGSPAPFSIFDDDGLQYDPVQLRNLRIVITVVIAYFSILANYLILVWMRIAFRLGRPGAPFFLAAGVAGAALYITAAILLWRRKNAGWQLCMIALARVLASAAAILINGLLTNTNTLGWLGWLSGVMAGLGVFLLRSPGIRDDAGINAAVLRRSVIIGIVLYVMEFMYSFFTIGSI